MLHSCPWIQINRLNFQCFANCHNSTVKGHVGSLNDLMSMKMMWIMCYSLYGHQLSTQFNTFKPDMLQLSTNIVRTPQAGLSGGCFISLVTCRINGRSYWSCSGGTWWDNVFVKHLLYQKVKQKLHIERTTQSTQSAGGLHLCLSRIIWHMDQRYRSTAIY